MPLPSLAIRDRTLAGVALTTAAYGLFSCQDAAIKLLVAGFSVWQVLFFRSITVVVCCVAVGGPDVLRQAARSRVFGAMLWRSFVILAAWLCFYTAARTLQLAELTVIYFAAPVIVMVLAIPLLGESVPLVRWVAVLTGFAGVYVACDPSKLGFSLPIVLVLAAAFLWALAIILMRKTALDEKTIVQMVLNNASFLVIAGLPMTFLWQTPDLFDLSLLIGAGLVGGAGQFLLFEGMKRAPATVIAPFEYTSLIWAFTLGYLIWGDATRREVVLGAVLIVGAGLIVIAESAVRRTKPA
ncbi:MAG: DMT family transporter [Methylobacterium mesophilicum]|nr:DMT family transporter [Methylobacterium mesophilicum]